MKIEVKKDGKILVDDAEYKIENITAEFLEKVVNESLVDNVNYILDSDETIPMVKLFKDLSSLCEKDSDFRKSIEQIQQKIEDSEKNEFEDTVDKELEENDIGDENEEMPF